MLPNTLNNPELIQNPKQGNEPQFIKHMSKQSKIFFIILGIIIVLILILTGVNIYINKQLKKDSVQEQITQNGKCVIGVNEYGSGSKSPENECLVCNSNAVSEFWSFVEEGTLCLQGQGVCSQGQCIPKLAPISVGIATDSSGSISSPANQ